jgi:8-hydroxy-5-deazaflavin:NADPH oxidoreductase
MRIGIIGVGMVGGTAARLFADTGHQVRVASSRRPDQIRDVARSFGPSVEAASIDDVAAGSELVLVAIPFGQYTRLPAAALRGKVVVDAMNYYPARDGQLDLGGTSSQALARHLPGAHVVKAFNTMYFQTLATSGRPDAPRRERLCLFVAGDDPEAKRTVTQLIEEIGFAAIDTGSLADSHRQEPGAPIYNRPLTPPEAEALLHTRASGPRR